MSHEGGPEQSQRTVAELLAKYGGEAGERAPRRRRRRADDVSDTGAQEIINRVLSESGEMPVISDDQPPPERSSHRRTRSGIAPVSPQPPTNNGPAAPPPHRTPPPAAQPPPPAAQPPPALPRRAAAGSTGPGERSSATVPPVADQPASRRPSTPPVSPGQPRPPATPAPPVARPSRSARQDTTSNARQPRPAPPAPNAVPRDRQPPPARSRLDAPAEPPAAPPAAEPSTEELPRVANGVLPGMPGGPDDRDGREPPSRSRTRPYQDPASANMIGSVLSGAPAEPEQDHYAGGYPDHDPDAGQGGVDQAGRYDYPAAGYADGYARPGYPDQQYPDAGYPDQDYEADYDPNYDTSYPNYADDYDSGYDRGYDGDYGGDYDPDDDADYADGDLDEDLDGDLDELDDLDEDRGRSKFGKAKFGKAKFGKAKAGTTKAGKAKAGKADDEADDRDDEAEDEAGSAAREWLVMAGQLALAVLSGAGVWLGFNWLWGALPQAALGVAVVVIVGMVFVVRKIRRAEDLQTTMLAILVGLVVTVTPAALLLLDR